MNSLTFKSTSGFTLIEILVITGLTVILLLSASAIFMTFLLNQSLVTQKQQIKIEGDNALKQMVQVIREAKDIENCENVEANQAINFTNILGNQGWFFLESNRVASTSAIGTIYLTSDSIFVSDFNPSCVFDQSTYLVKIEFKLVGVNPGFGQTPFEQTFKANVNLRN